MGNLKEAIESLYRTNLGVKEGERVLVFTDYPEGGERIREGDRKRWERLLPLAEKVAEVGREFAIVFFITYPSLGSHGMEPPEEVWKMAFGERAYGLLKEGNLLGKILKKEPFPGDEVERILKDEGRAVDVVIALSNYSTSHTTFRDLLTRCGARYASMPLFEEAMFYGPMAVDWYRMKERAERVKTLLEGGSKVEIEAPNGTHLSLVIEGREVKADTGLLLEPGSFGNLPAGEVFLAPLEGSAEGRLVLEWAPTHRLSLPVTLRVRGGVVEVIEGEDPYRYELERILERNHDFRNIAELGIGMNDKARRPDNILESEKILGTIHIALGDNSSFGGRVRTPFHQDFIVFKPSLIVIRPDGKREEIIRSGKLLID